MSVSYAMVMQDFTTGEKWVKGTQIPHYFLTTCKYTRISKKFLISKVNGIKIRNNVREIVLVDSLTL